MTARTTGQIAYPHGNTLANNYSIGSKISRFWRVIIDAKEWADTVFGMNRTDPSHSKNIAPSG